MNTKRGNLFIYYYRFDILRLLTIISITLYFRLQNNNNVI